MAQHDEYLIDIISKRLTHGPYHAQPVTILVGHSEKQIKLVFQNDDQKSKLITENFYETLLALERFGHRFNHFNYNVFNFGSPESLKIFEQVDRFCKHTTKDVTICSTIKNELAKWTYSFDNTITNITFDQYDSESESIILNHLFPYMEQLSILTIWKAAADHYPHLTKFSIMAGSEDANDANVTEFVRLNPQLRSFHATISNIVPFLKYLNETLPNLESLGTRIREESFKPSSNPETIHFKNVKEFSMDFFLIKSPRTVFQNMVQITFDQLEKFTLRVDHDAVVAECIDILKEYKSVRAIETLMLMSNEQILSVVEALPSLQEISILISIRDFTILEKLMEVERITRIRLLQCFKSLEYFPRSMSSEWEITADNSRAHSAVVFTRKN